VHILHKTLVVDCLTCVQNILQRSIIGPFDIVGLGICLWCLHRNLDLTNQADTNYFVHMVEHDINTIPLLTWKTSSIIHPVKIY